MARPGSGAGEVQLCIEGSQPELTGRLFSSPGFWGKTRDLHGGASSSATHAGRGKTQSVFCRSAFLLLFIGSHFGFPLPGWGATSGGLCRAGMGLACASPRSLSQGPKLFFQVLFQDTLISFIPALAAWFFCCCCRCYGWMFAASCGRTLLMTWQKAATG